jgi:hypothetical protein
MSIRFYLIIIAGLLIISSVNRRDSDANPNYKCYVYEQGCK